MGHRIDTRLATIVLSCTVACCPPPTRSAEPPLPLGLTAGPPPDDVSRPEKSGDEPALPPGLGAGLEETGEAPASGTRLDHEPDLPLGLAGRSGAEPGAQTSAAPDETAGGQSADHSFRGFWDTRIGTRLQADPLERQTSLAETRLHGRYDRFSEHVDLTSAGDLVYDALAEQQSIDLETGEGFLDLRQANAAFRLGDHAEAKVGRQILTWGTGDLIFINDLFPKDFRSFFLGRDEEYLKAPSDALKVSWFSDWVNLDLVYTPRFDADRYIDGSRISFFNPITGMRAGRDSSLTADRPDDWFDDSETALRLHRQIAGYELAGYAYRGFWKSPAGADANTGDAVFPALSVYGFSVRGVVGPGIGYVETGYYDSRDDGDGSDPLIANSNLRLLLGYEQSIARETTLGLQYYVEYMLDYRAYRETLPEGVQPDDENRHVLTLRLTHLALQQDLTLSLFGFYSPTDHDSYVKSSANYRLNDQWSFELGVNWFAGQKPYTFFGQFENNTNAYLATRFFLVRSRHMYSQNGSWPRTLAAMFGEPARAIIRNILVVAIGFLPLLLAPLVPYNTVGTLIATILLSAGIATLVIVPARLSLWQTHFFVRTDCHRTTLFRRREALFAGVTGAGLVYVALQPWASAQAQTAPWLLTLMLVPLLLALIACRKSPAPQPALPGGRQQPTR